MRWLWGATIAPMISSFVRKEFCPDFNDLRGVSCSLDMWSFEGDGLLTWLLSGHTLLIERIKTEVSEWTDFKKKVGSEKSRV